MVSGEHGCREMQMNMTVIKPLLGLFLGAGLGFLYYRFIGCTTGACPLTSNPWISSIYGAVLGLLVTLN